MHAAAWQVCWYSQPRTSRNTMWTWPQMCKCAVAVSIDIKCSGFANAHNDCRCKRGCSPPLFWQWWWTLAVSHCSDFACLVATPLCKATVCENKCSWKRAPTCAFFWFLEMSYRLFSLNFLWWAVRGSTEELGPRGTNLVGHSCRHRHPAQVSGHNRFLSRIKLNKKCSLSVRFLH